jgi:hypothetical protein
MRKTKKQKIQHPDLIFNNERSNNNMGTLDQNRAMTLILNRVLTKQQILVVARAHGICVGYPKKLVNQLRADICNHECNDLCAPDEEIYDVISLDLISLDL